MPYHDKPKRHMGVLLIMITALALSIVIVVSLYMFKGNDDNEPSPPTSVSGGSISIAFDTAELSLYETTSGKLVVSPDGANVKWKSSDESIATVNEKGEITAVKQGNVTITAESPDGTSATCLVSILPLPELSVKNDNGAFSQGELDELRALLKKKPLAVSIYYRDLSTGAELLYNAEKKYQAGSVVKAPYCKWLTASGTDLNQTVTLEKSSILAGGGKVKDSPIGTAFTASELIDHAIISSDNTAYNMLAQKFGFEGFSAYGKSLGVYTNQSKGNIFGSMSAIGAGQYFTDIYNYSNSAPEQSAKLMEDLKSTEYNHLISAAVEPIVAHKYGYNEGNNGFHDAGIVYDERPYIVTAFSVLSPNQGDTIGYLESIITQIEKIHR